VGWALGLQCQGCGMPLPTWHWKPFRPCEPNKQQLDQCRFLGPLMINSHLCSMKNNLVLPWEDEINHYIMGIHCTRHVLCRHAIGFGAACLPTHFPLCTRNGGKKPSPKHPRTSFPPILPTNGVLHACSCCCYLALPGRFCHRQVPVMERASGVAHGACRAARGSLIPHAGVTVHTQCWLLLQGH